MLFRYSAGSTPSALKTSRRWPPPGQMTTAAPVALSFGGRKTVIDGSWMFLTQ